MPGRDGMFGREAPDHDLDPDELAEYNAASADQDRRASTNGHAPKPDLLAGIRNGAWLDAQDFPPLTYTVPGIIPEGSVLLVGPPKVGKSWLVLTVALAVAAGGRALGLQVDARPVLYLALEDGHRRLQDRCHKLLDGDATPPAFEFLIRVEHGQVVNTIKAWLDRHPDAAPLVILDTLGKVMPTAGPGETTYQRDYAVGTALKDLVEAHPGATLLVNHHDRKAAAADFIDSVSGTNGLAGAADTIILLARDRFETTGLLKVTGRDVPEDEYAVTFTDGSLWGLDGSDLAEAARRARDMRATAGVGDRMAEVVRYVLGRPDGVGTGELAGALGMDPDAASAYLGRAVKAGRISRPRRGFYTPVGSVGSVGSEEGRPSNSQQTNTPNTPLESEAQRRQQLGEAIAFVAGDSPQDREDAERLVDQAPDLAALIDPTGEAPTLPPWGDDPPLAWALVELARRLAGADNAA